MQYKKLGRSGLDVSPICIGCMGFGEPSRAYPNWSLDEEASRALIRRAIEAGINFFDTANMYSNGGSEEIVGRALRDFTNRDTVVIATKVAAATHDGPNAIGLSRKAILTEIARSLTRLGTDYVDLYQIHRRDQLTPWEETLEALHDLVKMGKVRYLGASSMKAWEFSKALHLQRENGWSRFISLQDAYNLVTREQYETDLSPVVAEYPLGVVPYFSLAAGFLTGKYKSAEDAKGVKREAAEAQGRQAEAIAATFLRQQGWTILAERVRTPRGEVDLVMRKPGMVVFVEVKARKDAAALALSLDRQRLVRVAAAAEILIPRYAEPGDDIRIDAVLIAPGRLPVHLEHVWQG